MNGKNIKKDIILRDGLLRAMASRQQLREVIELGGRKKRYTYAIEHSVDVGSRKFEVSVDVKSLCTLNKKTILRLTLAYLQGKYPELTSREKFIELLRIFPEDDVVSLMSKHALTEEQVLDELSTVYTIPKEIKAQILCLYNDDYQQINPGYDYLLSWVSWTKPGVGTPYKYTLGSAQPLQRIQQLAEIAQQCGTIGMVGRKNAPASVD